MKQFNISKIQLSIDKDHGKPIDYNNDYTDVIVTMDSGDKYVASFYTLNKVAEILEYNVTEGAFLGGRYFWAENMVFVKDCTQESAEKIVRHLIDEGDFKAVFKKL